MAFNKLHFKKYLERDLKFSDKSFLFREASPQPLYTPPNIVDFKNHLQININNAKISNTSMKNENKSTKLPALLSSSTNTSVRQISDTQNKTIKIDEDISTIGPVAVESVDLQKIKQALKYSLNQSMKSKKLLNNLFNTTATATGESLEKSSKDSGILHKSKFSNLSSKGLIDSSLNRLISVGARSQDQIKPSLLGNKSKLKDISEDEKVIPLKMKIPESNPNDFKTFNNINNSSSTIKYDISRRSSYCFRPVFVPEKTKKQLSYLLKNIEPSSILQKKKDELKDQNYQSGSREIVLKDKEIHEPLNKLISKKDNFEINTLTLKISQEAKKSGRFFNGFSLFPVENTLQISQKTGNSPDAKKKSVKISKNVKANNSPDKFPYPVMKSLNSMLNDSTPYQRLTKQKTSNLNKKNEIEKKKNDDITIKALEDYVDHFGQYALLPDKKRRERYKRLRYSLKKLLSKLHRLDIRLDEVMHILHYLI